MSDIECIRSQNDEFKALEYIYLDQFHTIKESSPHKFSIMCQPYGGTQGEYQIKLMFEFTQNYPKAPLKYEIEPVTGLTRDNLATITRTIEDIIHENSDRPIVYDIVEQIRSWIQEYLVEGKLDRDEEDVFYKKKQEVFQKPKFSTFTPVTVESFTAWKKEFDARNKLKKIEKKQTQIKVTGKEWFLGKKGDEIDEEDEDEDDEEFDEEDEEEEEKVQPPADDLENNELFNPN